MNLRRKQLGLGFWGLLLVLAVGGFAALVLIKCVPIYLNEMAVTRAVHDVASKNTASGGEVDVAAIRDALQRRWDIDYINRIEPKEIKVVRDESGLKLSYDYEAREHLFYNIFIVIHFAEDIPLRSSVG
jgi:hypothetical protein